MMESLPPRSFGEYEIIDEISKGGTAVLYLVRRPRDKQRFALKVLRSDLGSLGPSSDLLRKEMDIISSLRHPAIVEVHDHGVWDGRPYLLMEYVEGGPLQALIDNDELSQRQAVRIAVRLSSALDYAHRLGVTHRDLKPENVLLTRDGVPKLVDFGMAATDDRSRASAWEALGTPAYMSPQQAGRGPVDHRTDIYSLGVVLFEMLTGRPPFQADAAMAVLDLIVRHDPPLPRSLNPGIPVQLENILLRAMEKDPGQRYQSAKAFGNDLRRFLTGQEVKAQGEQRARRRLKAVARHPIVALAAAAGVGLLSFLLGRALLPAADARGASLAPGEAGRLCAETGTLLEKAKCWSGAMEAYAEAPSEDNLERVRALLARRIARELEKERELGDADYAGSKLADARERFDLSSCSALAKAARALEEQKDRHREIQDAMQQALEAKLHGRWEEAIGLYRQARRRGSTPELENRFFRTWFRR